MRKESLRPRFKGLRENSMICIGKSLVRNLFCDIPGETFFVDENAHHLCNRYGWMCVVELNSNFLRKIIIIIMKLFISPGNICNGCRYKEVLLFQTQFLARKREIVRIEDLGNIFTVILVFNGPYVIAAVEIVEIKFAR